MLLKLLETSRESRTLAVGASDLGNFISAHPHGRSIVTGMVLSHCGHRFMHSSSTGGFDLQVSHVAISFEQRGSRAPRLCGARADLRGKELAMRLMMHPDAEVQKQALLCVQKILLAKDKVAFLNSA